MKEIADYLNHEIPLPRIFPDDLPTHNSDTASSALIMVYAQPLGRLKRESWLGTPKGRPTVNVSLALITDSSNMILARQQMP